MDAPAVLAHVEAWIDSQRARFPGPGVAFGLTSRERTIGTLTIGEAAPDVPLSPQHLLPIASVSKSFTAALVMQEREAGRIDLDASVQTYLPWFRPPSPFGPITVHHLLSHTSGLAIGQEATGEAVNELLLLAGQEPGFEPGERFWYSNAGYKAIGLILETIAGRPWFELARERLLRPLGMDATEPVLTYEVVPRVAPAFVPPFGDRPWHTSYGLVPAPWAETGTADGTICSTAEDMCAYLRMWLARGGTVLSRASFRTMTQAYAHDPDDRVDYGYGLWSREVDGRRLIGHSGSFGGYTAFMMFDPASGFGAAVLHNGDCPWTLRRDLLAFAIATAAASQGGEELPPIPAPRTLATVDDAEGYVGTFGPVRVEATGDGLTASLGGDRATLEVAGSDAFVSPLPALSRFPIRFEREGGEAVAMAHGADWHPRAGHEPPEAPGSDPAWEGLVGHYRGFGLSTIDVRVLIRRGRLRLTDGALGTDDELVPLPDGSFRVGAESWWPDRIRFDTEVGGRMTRAMFDGAPLYRTFTA